MKEINTELLLVEMIELTFPSKSDTFSLAAALIGVFVFNPADGGPLPGALLPVAMLGLGAVLAGASDTRGFTVPPEGVGEVTVGTFLVGAAAGSLVTVLLVVTGVVGFVDVDVARGLVRGFAAVEPLALGTREARLEVVAVDLSVVGTRFPPTAEDAPEGGSLVPDVFVLPTADELAGAFEELGLPEAFVPPADVDGLAGAPLAPNIPA
jgi:hypothetical protein